LAAGGGWDGRGLGWPAVGAGGTTGGWGGERHELSVKFDVAWLDVADRRLAHAKPDLSYCDTASNARYWYECRMGAGGAGCGAGRE
jgi:hypothetical protein